MQKYESIQNVPRDEREKMYEDIRSDISPIVEKHGENIVRWALSKYNTEERRKAILKETIKTAQQELDTLK